MATKDGDTVAGLCPDCGPGELTIDGREASCASCGATVEEVVETRREAAERRLSERMASKTTVGELREALAAFDEETPVVLTCSGAWNHASAEVRRAEVGGYEVADIVEEGL